MLYDFYKRQNETRANSVHATYLIYGIKSAKPSRGDENGHQMDIDIPNVNSQKLSPLQTLTLVEEKNLNGRRLLPSVETSRYLVVAHDSLKMF